MWIFLQSPFCKFVLEEKKKKRKKAWIMVCVYFGSMLLQAAAAAMVSGWAAFFYSVFAVSPEALSATQDDADAHRVAPTHGAF
eukprot:NODE_7_length_4010_cov_238.804298.p12 GENE.NODE_7_length_4010_cov_238.804298~~NODE_7_length_4010_cov_238.804298.p12  ORF type:complete len:83 (-),score=18.59 NODE_7_length_4010_cov_238.804298:53-301(-)